VRVGRRLDVEDRDGTVSLNERLRITDTTPGTYDARLKDTTGRVCFARNLKAFDLASRSANVLRLAPAPLAFR
jgi:hypothetical protein